ncbi:MAG: tetratricopeptide repeat protein [Planctomycetota bacterium]|jgi:tetratricopeptide (TPR) repeat protein
MRAWTILFLAWHFLFVSSAPAQTYESEHFIIYSDLDPRYVRFIQANAEAYYRQMEQLYFRTGGVKRIKIYYSKTQADTQKLFYKHGLNEKAYYGRYVAGVPAIYTHRLMDAGGPTGWGTLFHEITHHFVGLNHTHAPVWFNEGLACLLGEQTRIVKGRASIGHPNPWREHALRKMIEKGEKINVKHLTSLTPGQFHKRRENYHPARALFYWLHDNGYLEKYLQNVRRNGYGLSVLEQTTGRRYQIINAELLSFVEKNCYAGAFLYMGGRSKDKARRERLFLKALELKPDYKAARLRLAWDYFRNRNHEKCRENLKPILRDSECIEYRGALELTGHIHYREQNHAVALKYYHKALDHSEYCEYKHELYHWMGVCYYFLKDHERARQFHKKFLDSNWEPDRLSKLVEHSKKYLKAGEKKS